ncbi:hypothetical protein GCM10011611_03800 [Aliidongia dinghuensis]|uniref:Secreted protein n=1 Tax=Aliidongia dinghuensis TaxID=1867774 RepID=A0A8J2YPI5_9PROT|nr:hypothetical protein [Aliidongia dinghuensis]GGF01517.1 hypothetical protein GCM10011611_03800 [Aliidongia dinghuensis]
MHRLLPAVVALLAVSAGPARAAIPGQNPDWPCQQRFVPALTAGTFWNGPLPDKADWHADPRVAALVADAAPREVPLDESHAKLAAFAKRLKPAERRRVLPVLFLGLVDATNDQRHEVMGRIEELTRRQRELGDVIAHVTDELQAISPDATGDAAARRAEIVQRRDFVVRSFEETQRTMRYACEVPVELEARLGDYARLLQADTGH